MLSHSKKNQQDNFAQESPPNMNSGDVQPDNDDCMETLDDVITVCTPNNMTHQQRYEYRKNRTYSKYRQSQSNRTPKS